MSEARRSFLKFAGLAGLLASLQLVSGGQALKEAGRAEGKVLWGMLIDLKRCVRCGRCVTACQEKNGLPENLFFNKMMTVMIDGKLVELPASCMHCRYPPCVYVCPVAATYRREDGIVEVDYSICIGCRYCITACPYLARVIVEEDIHGPIYIPKGVVAKCNFCRDLIDMGLKPACVEACPFNARTFGNLKDPNSEIARILASKRHVIVLRPELGTWPVWYYAVG